MQTNERTMHEMNERYTKRTHDTRTNESLERNHIFFNEKQSWFYRSTMVASQIADSQFAESQIAESN